MRNEAGGAGGRSSIGTGSTRLGAVRLLAGFLLLSLVGGCAVVGGGSGGREGSESLAPGERTKRAFRTDGSRHDFEAFSGVLDSGMFGPSRAGASETFPSSPVAPLPFALAGIGFPQIATAPDDARPARRRFVPLLDWQDHANEEGTRSPRPRIRCMNLSSRTVARRAAPFLPTIERLSAEHGLDPSLVKALIARESCFDPGIVSRAGAIGLMQVMPATGRELGAGNLFKPANNLDAGVRYLAKMHDLFDGDVRLALAAYNAGPGSVRRFGGIPPYAETRAYVERVLAYQRRYRALELFASL